jgi:exo-beta-1,3-glucanase (GH17 family)
MAARAAVLILAFAGALGALAWWHARGVPVALADAAIERLPCVSYAPYRRPGQTPFAKGFVVSPAQIDADLALLAQRTRCVRTYSVDQGLDAVPALARKHGLRVLLGLWIGRDRAENERELARGLEVLRRDADAIDAVIVGNEVMLRRELPAAVLAGYIARVRAATPLPVTYADVWEFWLRHAELADAVSFVTVHLLPYWEDEPMPIDRAIDHVMRILERMRAAFPGKEVFVGEVGWPSRGRRREGAVPSAVNQARFVRELANAAAAAGTRYNVIEAFDQPWKRRLEGTVGGFWGVLDAAGREKFSLRGPMIEDPAWRRGFVAAGMGALLFALAGRAGRPRPLGILVLGLAGAALGGAAAAQFDALAAWSRNAFELALGAAFAAISAAATLLAALGLARRLDGRAPLEPAPIGAVAAWLRTNACRWTATERLFGAVRFALLFGAAAAALALAFDPRYRDFPLALAAPPIVALAALARVGGMRAGPEERALAAVLAAAAPVIVAREGLANPDALAWAALSLAFAAAVWGRPVRRDATREDEEAEEAADRAGRGRVQHEPGGAEAEGGERPS